MNCCRCKKQIQTRDNAGSASIPLCINCYGLEKTCRNCGVILSEEDIEQNYSGICTLCTKKEEDEYRKASQKKEISKTCCKCKKSIGIFDNASSDATPLCFDCRDLVKMCKNCGSVIAEDDADGLNGGKCRICKKNEEKVSRNDTQQNKITSAQMIIGKLLVVIGAIINFVTVYLSATAEYVSESDYYFNVGLFGVLVLVIGVSMNLLAKKPTKKK